VTKKKTFDLTDAYAVRTPDDSRRLYAAWAETYDADFIKRLGYVYHQQVVELLVKELGDSSGPVLDVGCGTGVVGVALRKAGVDLIDGIDISREMLAEARRKLADDGCPVYRKLIEADMTRTLGIPDNRYAALISTGTFTHGHLGPGVLDELWRVAAPGAACAIGVNAAHFEAAGFGGKLAVDAAAGRITNPELVPVDIYSGDAVDEPHAADRALVVICRILI